MLDPAHPQVVDLRDFEAYLDTCLELTRQRLAGVADAEAAAAMEDDLNRYPRIDHLEEPRDIWVLDEKSIGQRDIERAAQALLDGRVLLEHTCAGEATRLGLGTKYLINPPVDLTPEVIARHTEGQGTQVDPADLRSITLGRRHMLQMAWDLSRLAEDMGQGPEAVLARQRLLVIVNEATAEQVQEDFRQARFYGFAQDNVLFMIQKSFHGIVKKGEQWIYDTTAPKRLHNHGQMLMQTTMDGEVFRLDDQGRPAPLSWAQYRDLLGEFQDKISFNIEDLDYLSRSLDLSGLAAALKLADEGARMVMEVVTNDPEHPIKGGMCAWDPELGRNVMIESFQLGGLDNSEIKFLNKNINHYPFPAEALTAAHEQGLSMPLAVKKGCVYFQPVQGDLNFLVPTAFVRRASMKPIHSWKSGSNTAAALEAMALQEGRPGFLEWARGLTGLEL